MKSSLPFILIAGLAASAAVIRRDDPVPCCFSLIAQGAISGAVGEDTIGENGIGGHFPQGEYCISNATLTDLAGHPCTILTSNGQFVCESNSISTSSRFTLADNGDLLHDGHPNYYACASLGLSNDGSYSIFSDSIADSTGCTSITILTGGFSCAVLGRPSSTSAPSASMTTAQIQSATTAVAAITQSSFTTPSCPTDISSGTYVAPNLIIPVSSSSPDTAFGTQYTAIITPENSTIFVFDIPFSYTGNCALIFQFPYGNRAQFPYTFSGIEEEGSSHGGLNFALLNGEIDDTTTFNSLPPVGIDYGMVEVVPGNNYTIAAASCGSGLSVSYEVSSVGGVVLEYFQSVGGSPIGAYVVPCL